MFRGQGWGQWRYAVTRETAEVKVMEQMVEAFEFLWLNRARSMQVARDPRRGGNWCLKG